MTFEEYKSAILAYLQEEKERTECDIRNHRDLSDDEKVAQGYLIKGCRIDKTRDGCYDLVAEENNTKLRAGDHVVLRKAHSTVDIKASVVEIFFDTISIETTSALDATATYDIYVAEAVFLDPVIKVIGDIQDGWSSADYLKELAGIQCPRDKGYRPINPKEGDIPCHLNEAQRFAIDMVLKKPSLYCIQGPPGTGKTDVLSVVARIFSENKNEVLIISNTHQAVNNALNKMSGLGLPVVKIGEGLKAQGLADDIDQKKTLSSYIKAKSKRRGSTKGSIVGMTLHAAIVQKALLGGDFYPNIVIADEAGQIPFSLGAAIGAFGAGSMVFIGDDRQMPPIFHPDMVDNPMSTSIFSHIRTLYPDYVTVLDTTYRMNTEIAQYVSRHFYEPYGIHLKGFRLPTCENSIEIHSLPCGGETVWQESNPEEAELAVSQAIKYMEQGLDVAIVTPFRKQVNCIREHMTKELKEKKSLNPILIDTVERLQGQDVDVIIISTSVSDPDYYSQVRNFILNPNRLNVMISRAKEKVCIIKNAIVEIEA